MNFAVPDECPMDAVRQRGARRQVQHIAMTQQLLSTHLVQDGARIHTRGDLESHPRRNVGLDQAGNDIHRRPLGGQHQVNSGRPCLLRQAGDQFFDFFADDHHHVGKLVNHNNDKRKSTELRCSLVSIRKFRLPQGVEQRFSFVRGILDFLVVTGQVTHAQRCHQTVAPIHFHYAPAQGISRFLHVCDNRGQQVGDALVYRQLEHLRVYHHQPNLLWRGLVQQA